MLIALDTSVLIAGALEDHPFHARAWVWHQAIHRGEAQGMVCGHALAEMYSVLTKLPNGLSPPEALVVVGTIGSQLRVMGPTTQTYVAAIERCASRSLTVRSGVRRDPSRRSRTRRRRLAADVQPQRLPPVRRGREAEGSGSTGTTVARSTVDLEQRMPSYDVRATACQSVSCLPWRFDAVHTRSIIATMRSFTISSIRR